MSIELKFERIGRMIAAEGTPDFPGCLADFLRTVAPYDFTVIFSYGGAARPLDLFDDFPREKRAVFVTDYQAGPYMLDPFFLAATKPVAPGLYRMRDLAPDRFYQGEYFRSYYVQTGLAEEIGFFIDTGRGAVVVVSLMRARKVFSAKEFAAIQSAWPIVEAACARHWADVADRFKAQRGTDADAPDGQIERSFQRFADGQLTPREREVVEYTLKGYSAEAIRQVLGISSGTVRAHRRNIYAKLGISSQGELFARFIDNLVKT
ncbi:LuxR C-terminal-related transcriptional regulator [Defluviimonas sp. D31]|uniref:helix-turn-helix transcriptional regulator n=1 Tax=Defluviimonas sp. D31 TaxID=3083253 RepID=UPI00296F5B8C|nr:LuxR C-terminal-related transcriptional regulator [Defluviimonas sp. D31]MDW4547839.1 LuxR C-terminal-related transcriptional regulator [Defluviimonas sp. D31]